MPETHIAATRPVPAEIYQAALGLGPLGVHPSHQGLGVGHALMHAVLAGCRRPR